MKTELNGYFSIELYAAMFERENFIQSNEQIKLEASGHALIYVFSFFDFQKTFLVYFRRNEPDIRPGSDADIFMSRT